MSGYMHHVSGRLRIKLPHLKGRAAAAAQASAAIGRIDGIVSVNANTVTGSLLIFYDIAAAESDSFWAGLRATLAEHGLSHQTDAGLRTTRGADFSPVTDKLVGALVEKLVERSALALVGALL